MLWQKLVFIVLILFCLTPYGSPPVALALGLLAAFTFGNPFERLNAKSTQYILQASVVLLGFGMDLGAIYKAGKQGILFTIATIFGTLALGYAAGKILGVERKTSALISAGTAICGGSAIGAVSPAINATAEQTSVSLGTVFVLNAIALFVFPIVGHGLHLSPGQFGLWAAIAIHDTSSVVGAAATFGTDALAIATTVKLARALWIAPVALVFAFAYREKNVIPKPKIVVPWFIFLFLAATVVRTYTPVTVPVSIFEAIVNLAKAGMTLALFLIGAGLTPETLRTVGLRPLLLAITLWIVISVVALIAVLELL